MGWYDWFAGFYDASLERLYLPHREEAVAALQLEPTSVVLDLACGTGANWPVLFAGEGPARVIGTDLSAGMLARARERAQAGGWLDRVALLERDARELTEAELLEAGGGRAPDRVICTLGLSVIPEWEAVLAHTLSVCAPGTRVVIYDVYAERWVPQTTMVRWMAQADLDRRIWEALAPAVDPVDHRFLEGSPHVFGGRPWLASGPVTGNRP